MLCRIILSSWGQPHRDVDLGREELRLPGEAEKREPPGRAHSQGPPGDTDKGGGGGVSERQFEWSAPASLEFTSSRGVWGLLS